MPGKVAPDDDYGLLSNLVKRSKTSVCTTKDQRMGTDIIIPRLFDRKCSEVKHVGDGFQHIDVGIHTNNVRETHRETLHPMGTS